jgi:hypothetical protein
VEFVQNPNVSFELIICQASEEFPIHARFQQGIAVLFEGFSELHDELDWLWHCELPDVAIALG